MKSFLLRCLFALVLALSFSSFASAQDAALTEQVRDQRAVIAQVKNRADTLEQEMKREGVDDTQLVDLRGQLDGLAEQALNVGVSFRERLAEINGRLDQLGPAPAEGQPPEPEVTRTERQNLTTEKGEINATIGLAEEQSLRVNTLAQNITQIRRDLFASALSTRYDLGAAISAETLADFRDEIAMVGRTFDGWLTFALNFKFSAMVIATLLALGTALVLFFGGRRLFGRLIERNPCREEVSYLSRLSVAFWSTLLPSASLCAFLVATYYLYDIFGVLRGDIGAMLVTIFNVTATVFFTTRLALAVLSPAVPNWRLLDIRSKAAWHLFWLVFATSLVTGLDFVLTRFNQVLGSPVSLTIAKSLIATIIVGVLLILIGLARPYLTDEGKPRGWPRAFRYFLVLCGAANIAAALLGYIGLARFVSQQMVVTGAILATMYLGYLSASAISDEGAFAHTSVGKRLKQRYNLDDGTEDQLGLLTGIVVNAIVVLCGLPLIMLQWGFQWGDLSAIAYRILNRVTIGSVSFSLIGILTGVAVFLIGYFVTRGFQHWLDGKVMARGKVDTGVRNSIRTAIGYLGIAIASLIGLSVAGIDLSNLALVAGALSLGIGFGLQNIVNNFVSGLILLAERPFKVGDWIVAGTTTGTVRKISVRATEIETFQRQTIILPNSELINAAVGNWTHKNKLGRVDVKIFVAYGSDLAKVNEILREIGRSNPRVLKNPEPFVAFTNILDYGLEFELRVFLSDILDGATVSNELRFAILERFDAEQIGIPYAIRGNTVTDDPGAPAPRPPVVADAAPVVLDPAEKAEVAAEPVPRAAGVRKAK